MYHVTAACSDGEVCHVTAACSDGEVCHVTAACSDGEVYHVTAGSDGAVCHVQLHTVIGRCVSDLVSHHYFTRARC